MYFIKKRGILAERFACRFLKQQGLKLVMRNYRARTGEIDMIMQDNDILVFVEVRLRRSQTYHSGADSVDFFKQQKLIKTAQRYLQDRQLSFRQRCRFDVIDLSEKDGQYVVNWIRNAFMC
mgnify:CR=1 FL=1|tara:strand:+ start:358 stop:720 length:363 start_codon:yes stop_codon:yes gene_type:complete